MNRGLPAFLFLPSLPTLNLKIRRWSLSSGMVVRLSWRERSKREPWVPYLVLALIPDPNPIPRPKPLLTSMSEGADPFSFTSRLFRAASRSSSPRSPEAGSPTSPLRDNLLMWY